MYKQIIARYIELVKEFDCAVAIFTEEGKIHYLNEDALGILGGKVINLELLPGRYVENEDIFEKLERERTIFVHKALLKAGTEKVKIRGMIHLIADRDPKKHIPATYLLTFEVREERIFGSVTLERIIEHSGFVAFHWVAIDAEKDMWTSRYVSNSVAKFGYKREDFYDGRYDWQAFIYEEDWPILKAQVLENIKKGKFEFSRQYRVVAKDGQVIPVHDYIHVVTDASGKLTACEVVIFDLLMETERNANLLLLENALNRSSNTVVVWQYGPDKMHRKQVRYVSSNMDQFGILPSALRSGEKNYYDYIHKEDREKVKHAVVQFEQKGYQYLCQEYRIINDAGQEFYVRDESNLVKLPGGTRYLESILTDITEAKQREFRLLKQQEQLERKIRYNESNDNLLNDMSIEDFVPKDELQELLHAFSVLTGSYNAIIDLDGDPITYPDGPAANMGSFYDMFERREYKQGYFKLNRQLRKEKQPVKMTLKEFSEEELKKKKHRMEELIESGTLMQLVKAVSKEEEASTPGIVVGLPLFLEDKHIATWICCAFTEKEMERIDIYLPSLWSVCKYMAQFVYSNTISQKQAQKARLSEVQTRELLERSSTVRDILRRCNETNEEEALAYVLKKVGEYLKISRISLFKVPDKRSDPVCMYEWDTPSGFRNVDIGAAQSPRYLKLLTDTFAKDEDVVLNGDRLPIRVRREFSDSHIRAVVSMPIRTLTKEQHFINFVESHYERIWTEDELSFMHTVISILQGFLQRMKSSVNVQDVKVMEREFLSLSREYIYMVDEDTDEVLYINPRLEELIGKGHVGKKCYEIFKKQSIHCMDCYNKRGCCSEVCNNRSYPRLFGRPMRIRQLYVNYEGLQHVKMILMSPEDGMNQ